MKYNQSIPIFTYSSSTFKLCEKCGSSNLGSVYFNDSVYRCLTCGFQKSRRHVSFGFNFKIPRYHSLTNTHSADKLFCLDGTRLSTRIISNLISIPSPGRTKKIWDMWIKEHPVEIIKLASISEQHILGCDHEKLDDDFNPITFLTEAISDQRGRYLNLLAMHSDVRHRKRKISEAIQYGIKNSNHAMYIGPISKDDRHFNFLENTCIRFHKYFKHFPNFTHPLKIIERPPIFNNIIFITGANLYICKQSGYDQESLDNYINNFFTKLENNLNDDQKIKIVINTGNSGVDTSIIRWAINNNKYVVVVNTNNFYFVDANNNVLSNSEIGTIDRLMNTGRKVEQKLVSGIEIL